jgi:RNA polymerase sigma-70 factor (ECF subfamily)
VNQQGEAVVERNSGGARLDLETIFLAQYERIARVIACVIRDPARAEELAVEVFLKWSREPKAHGENAEGWLYRTAVRMGQNELRREMRQGRYERLVGFFRNSPTTPEELLSASQEEEKVRVVLSIIAPRHAELLLLRGQGLSYEELASALDLNPRSVGTFLNRAQQAFRKQYIRLYERGQHGKE